MGLAISANTVMLAILALYASIRWARVHDATRAGDLRVAHFFGIHGFQAAPIVAALTRRGAVVYVAGALWAVLVVALYWLAQSGVAMWPAPGP